MRTMTIVPMRDLKDTVKIEKICAESKSPIFVTKNGYGKLVVMDIDCFDRLLNEAYEIKMINEALDDVKAGRVSDAKEFLNEMKTKYGF